MRGHAHSLIQGPDYAFARRSASRPQTLHTHSYDRERNVAARFSFPLTLGSADPYPHLPARYRGNQRRAPSSSSKTGTPHLIPPAPASTVSHGAFPASRRAETLGALG
ncbi:hypothetical protein NUW54_g14386 [Trametes sanguinea]|uniref:Uncharacterized protein n=1 Tax=Trametes sanguinea TaxID=158606 RepID=A0ACC1MCW0_9APHY|nr:hypothetical protein NUW54_g14386 [Trametes sanguinea]